MKTDAEVISMLQREIRRLRAGNQAMKEGVAIRIADMEKEIERLRARLSDVPDAVYDTFAAYLGPAQWGRLEGEFLRAMEVAEAARGIDK